MWTRDVDSRVSTAYSPGLPQVMRSTGYASPYEAQYSAVHVHVIGCSEGTIHRKSED